MNTNIRVCSPSLHEELSEAEHAFQSGEITREQRDDAIRAAIAAEVERKL